MKLFLRIPEGTEDLPHCWNIETDDGMFLMCPHNLVDEARPLQAKIIRDIVNVYNNRKQEVEHAE